MDIKQPIRMTSAEFNQNPHGYFAWMRREQPVCRVKVMGRTDAYLITRYADVEAALLDNDRLMKNPRTAKTESGKSANFWLPKTFRPLMHNMLNTDEPDHRRLRNLVHKAFTPRMIMQLQPRIEAIAQQLLDKAATQAEVELVSQFALPLPITVICEMFGIPEQDRDQFRKWSASILVNPTPLNVAKAALSVRSFLRYMRKLAEQRRADPQDDLLTALVKAEDEGETFSDDELIGMAFLILVAGHETTVGLIGNGTRALLNNPEQLELLRNKPTLIDSAIEEMLRYDGPLQTGEQSFAKQTFTLHGVTIPKGMIVLNAILSANRDETVFEDADSFLIERTPNKHLAFGKGIHYCLGAPLARLEAKIAFCTLLEYAPNLRLSVPESELRYSDMMMINRVQQLPVAFH